ncbi:FKBP-type peptidyl-prolyl cis-trans isomerase [Luteolibacter ambystomatis]|uniref:Peptidyl-prolyl cis-trans isomerase n=1 Tax=Luteolibacter ambystomatis TaxID=2824561 RepID=A0A975J1X6_9BACT|nr:FKBP-type peptidyl-prolyl cis-trans isomerase [Luteolibacter ambystomatis]QUE52474.1 FKBP-type peptidyl-prolyl cis-trans isomerase [Luteolibacter ambystomatis]
MIRTLIPGALAIGLATAAPAAETPSAAAAPAAPATKQAAKPEAPPADPAAVKSDSSYALGFRTGSSFSQEYGRFGIGAADLDTENFVKGFTAALKGGKPDLSEDKLQAAMKALGDQLQKREQDLATKNLDDGKKFLEQNGKREGVITTKSGLQYEVLGKGGDKKYQAPKDGKEDNKEFHVHYKGTLIDGTQFDASPEGETVPMTLQVIDGFKEALTTMPVGAKWKLFIPGALAYGEQRRSLEIGPNQLLIFELELVDIKDAPPAPEGGLPGFLQGAPGGGE